MGEQIQRGIKYRGKKYRRETSKRARDVLRTVLREVRVRSNTAGLCLYIIGI